MRELPTPTLNLSPVSRPRGLLHPRSPAQSQPLVARPLAETPAAGGIEVSWARHLDEVREAQRLRHAVFAVEMGAILSKAVPGHDVDLFDDFCEHLLVRDSATRQVIGTYRVLTPAQARRVGSTYSDTEFDLTRLRNVRERMVELGRSCVHRDHRHGGVIMALWGALAEFMVRNQLDTMIGCASIPMLHNGVVSGDVAASIWEQLRQTHLAPIEYHVRPRLPLPVEHLDNSVLIPMNHVPNNIKHIPRDKPVVVYCHHGMRSASVIQFLEQNHQFDNLYNLTGGINAWAYEIDPQMDTY